MAIRPEYFYHPAVGGLSPAVLGSCALSLAVPTSFSEPSPMVSEMPSSSTPRKTMSLARTAICAVTGETLPTAGMIRFVVTPEREVIPDLSERLPGRFLWIKAERAPLQKAIWRNTFASVARENVIVPKDLIERTSRALSSLALQSLHLARRAGEFRQGFTKVEESLKAKEAALYIVASDAKENGREKLERLATALEIPVIDIWSVEELSAAIHENNVVHAALLQGGVARSFITIVHKLKAIGPDTTR